MPDHHSPLKIAVFLPNWIGDTVMATPALRSVRRRFPDAEITGVLRPYISDVLAGLGLMDHAIFHDPRGPFPANRGWRLALRLRRRRFDLALLLTNSFRSAWMARLSGARRRVGFRRNGRGWLLTDRLRPRPRSQPHPVLDEYLRLAEHVGCTELTRTMELATLPEDEWRLERFWERHDPRLRSKGVVCLNPGGAFGSAKHWPAESFAELARRLAEERGRTVLVLCGPQEREAAREIVRRAAHPDVVGFGDLSGKGAAEGETAPDPWPLTPGVGLTKAAIRHAELLVTTDSGPRHFAAPFGVPAVTLFGPTHPAWSETYAPEAVHLQLDLECGPCQKRECPLDHHLCMRGLSVQQVFEAATAVLDRRESRRPLAS